MFIGSSNHTLDTKHRVFVPKRFQAVLDHNSNNHLTGIIARGFEDCLTLYTQEGFAQISKSLLTNSFDGPQQRTMQRLFFSTAKECQLDKSGRVVIPEALRKLAGIGKEVVFVGVFDRAEIWSKEKWDTFDAENGDDFDSLDQVIKGPGEPSA